MFDVIIIGAGPAGLTTLLYAAHYGLKCVCIGDTIGGKFLLAPDAINYPGIPNTTGPEFIKNLCLQLSKVQTTYVQDFVLSILKLDSRFKITTSKGSSFETKTVVIATGNGKKQRENHADKLAAQLGLPTENGFISAGVNGMTSRPGVFVAGDCCKYPESFEQLSTAVSSGIWTAAGVYEYLKNEKAPILWGTAKIPRR
jgi:thioredoxin reductase